MAAAALLNAGSRWVERVQDAPDSIGCCGLLSGACGRNYHSAASWGEGSIPPHTWFHSLPPPFAALNPRSLNMLGRLARAPAGPCSTSRSAYGLRMIRPVAVRAEADVLKGLKKAAGQC
jgi:hypothetical protein